MKKKLFALLALAVCALLAGCAEGKQKPITGIDPCFSEELGYYNESPSVIQIGSVRYLYYTRNAVKNDRASDTVAVRKGTWDGTAWKWGAQKTVLSPSGNGWDGASVFGADVVAGEFAYEGKTYAYLMAYAGSEKTNRSNAQIGFAVSDSPDGEFLRVGKAPVVSFDKRNETPVGLTSYKGVNEPSLVSFDQKGKLTLFYSHYGKFEGTYGVEMDCSDLSAVVRGGRMLVERQGLADGMENTTLYAGDFAYDPDGKNYVVCRNYAGAVNGLPSVAEAVQAVCAAQDEIFAVREGSPNDPAQAVWSLYNASYRRISALHTSVEEDPSRMNGYPRVYNGCVATDEYGYTLSSRSVDLYFTTSATDGDGLEGDEYLFTPMIHEFTLERRPA